MSMLTEYAPLITAAGAVVVAGLAWMSVRRRPQVDAATADKIKTEIERDQVAARQENAAANAKRDRHIVRLERWAFEKVRPWARQAVVQNDKQNELLVKLASDAGYPYTPKPLPDLPDPPLIDDSE